MDNAGDDGIQLDDASNVMKIQQKTVYGAYGILDRTFIALWSVLRKRSIAIGAVCSGDGCGRGIPLRLWGYHRALATFFFIFTWAKEAPF